MTKLNSFEAYNYLKIKCESCQQHNISSDVAIRRYKKYLIVGLTQVSV